MAVLVFAQLGNNAMPTEGGQRGSGSTLVQPKKQDWKSMYGRRFIKIMLMMMVLMVMVVRMMMMLTIRTEANKGGQHNCCYPKTGLEINAQRQQNVKQRHTMPSTKTQ